MAFDESVYRTGGKIPPNGIAEEYDVVVVYIDCFSSNGGAGIGVFISNELRDCWLCQFRSAEVYAWAGTISYNLPFAAFATFWAIVLVVPVAEK